MKTAILLLLSLVTGSLPLSALAADPQVGKVVALRGNATIERRGKSIPAAVKSPIEANDAFRTGPNSRAKLLFVDDSVLTLGENTRMSIREFVHQKGKGGSSIYNLIDGKMRSVVGRTRFEVRTPTAVAAARGTVIYFEVGRLDNQDYSKILCLEGKVDVRSTSPAVTGGVTLTPGKMVVVTANKPVPPPVQAPQVELERAGTSGDSGGSSEQTPAPQPELKPDVFIPPVKLEASQPSKVKIRIDTPQPYRP
jgi:hypothetical protein